jgi:death-on-curing protein
MKVGFIRAEDALVLHRRAMECYGGLDGICGSSALQSAICRPINVHNYDETADMCDLASALVCEITQNHPFNDGNKRTGLLAGLLFLERNGMVSKKLQIKE